MEGLMRIWKLTTFCPNIGRAAKFEQRVTRGTHYRPCSCKTDIKSKIDLCSRYIDYSKAFDNVPTRLINSLHLYRIDQKLVSIPPFQCAHL